MRILVRALVCATFVGSSIVLLHCGAGVAGGTLVSEGGAPNGSDGGSPTHPLGSPTNHIPSAPMCRMTRPPGVVNNPDAGIPGCGPGMPCCTQDSDCTSGKNGRCERIGNGEPSCTYDQCFAQSDCGSGTTCACADPMSNGATNECLPSDCRTDADCGAYFCSPSYGTSCGAYGGYVGVHCHTANDDCANDSDCTGNGSGGTTPGYCAFDSSVKKWVCEYSFCAG